MTTTTPATYEVRDSALAAFLRCRNHRLVSVKRDRQGRPTFVFEDSPQRADDIQLFVAGGSIEVVPKELLSAFRALQSAIATAPRLPVE